MTYEDPRSPEELGTYEARALQAVHQAVDGIFRGISGDPDDPVTQADRDSWAAHEAQDAAFDQQAAFDELWEMFMMGIRAADGYGVGFSDPAWELGTQVGFLIRGAVALNPELAPLWDFLVKG